MGETLRSYPRTIFCLLTTLWADSLHFPPELMASCMAGKSARKSQKRRGPSRDIMVNPAQATHLWDPDAEVCELGGDASLPSSACIALNWHPFKKPVLILAEEISSAFTSWVMPFCTQSRGLVLKTQSLPHWVNLCLFVSFSSVQNHLLLSPIGARTLKMPVPYSPRNVGAYIRTPSHQPLVFGRRDTDHLP